MTLVTSQLISLHKFFFWVVERALSDPKTDKNSEIYLGVLFIVLHCGTADYIDIFVNFDDFDHQNHNLR